MLHRVLLIILLLWATPAQATTAIAVSDAQQALLSDAVVIAVVGEHQHQENARLNMIETHTKLHIEEVMYGSLSPKINQAGVIQLIQAGGTIGERTLFIPGDARLKQGERCVFFLNEEAGSWYLTALQQSRYLLVSDARRGTLMQRQLEGGLVIYTADGYRPYTAPEKPMQTLLSFRELLAELSEGGSP